eukprot:c29055_g1_i2 orf=951-3830(+)
MPNRKLVVEVCHASNLPPKDGEGSSSPYVEVDFDTQRHRTKTKVRDLNPVWNEKLEFNVSDPDVIDEESVEVSVYTQRRNQQRHLLGRVRIPGVHFKKRGTEGADKVVPYSLERRWFLSPVKGEIFLKTYYYDDVPAKKEDKPKEEKKETPVERKDQEKKQQDNQQKATAPEKKSESKAAATAPAFYTHTETMNFDVHPTNPNLEWEKVTHDLVTPMEYLFVRVVKARDLAAKDVTGSSDPYVELKVGSKKAQTRVVSRSLNPEWNQVFAFDLETFNAGFLEIDCWDKDVVKDDFLGHVSFEIAEIPSRKPPDSPLAPTWYKLEPKKNEKRVKGEIMLAVWIGTQADEAFSEAWQSDTGGLTHTRSKVYLSPKLWYLRVHVIEAQDLTPSKDNRFPEVFVRTELGFQIQRTSVSSTRNTSPSWGEDIFFVAAEPLQEQLVITVLDRVGANKDEVLGIVRIPLSTVPKRADHRPVPAKWYDLEKEKKEGGEKDKEKEKEEKKKDSKFSSRIHLKISLDGGYHVLDESIHYSSDTRPTDKRLWKAPIGVLELGILGATNLLPMKTREGISCTDSYCVAKYGPKWVKTRTVVDNFNPKWNEQYTWEVYDPCTVLTVGVFDNQHLLNGAAEKAQATKDQVIGKVRIRLSTLETEKVYTHSYPLIVLDKSGMKKKGELELAVRFSCSSRWNMMFAYFLPLLPKMHYLHPFHPRQQEQQRNAAMRIVITRLARSEPPIRKEVVEYMLDVDSHMWSLRKSKANWYRIQNVFAGLAAVVRWFKEICEWKNPVTTVLVHVLFLILVWYPELILPTFFLYMFLIGLWHFRFRDRHPPHMDVVLSYANSAEPDELDEEFDVIPTSKTHEIVRMRYDRLRLLAGRIQTVMGDLATQLERFHSFLSWRDPRATVIFICFCLLAAIILYVTPFRVIAILLGVYLLRHPRFRHGMPSVILNFFRRLPALSDRML